MQILFIILVIAIVAALAIYQYYRNEQRKKALRELALRNGWHFRAAKDWGMDARYAAFSCFQKGSNRYAFNILQGSHDDRPICAFDYHYETYSTDSKGRRQTHHHYFSAVVLDTNLPLKPLVIRPEGFFDKIGEFFGLDDIDFESAQFSREFHVTSPDRRWAFDVIHQATMEYLLAAPRFTLEFAGPRVAARRGKRLNPEEFEVALQVACGVLDRLPNYLLREWKGAVR
ncbi:MAG: hypothetical protein DWQ37_12405 [Planctomycetota bacterium]|nr:MAG: hypothetical protein DWQ37_12405 [Planctomycetota bacterium]